MSTPILVVSRYLPGEVVVEELDEADARNDALDDFNHPRTRRAHLLKELNRWDGHFQFDKPPVKADSLDLYRCVHSPGLIDFFESAWKQWEALGDAGRDPLACLSTTNTSTTPPLVPGNTTLPRDTIHERPSRNVMGQIGYYCTDTCTPILGALVEELCWDAAVVQAAVQQAAASRVVYALTTHPGHHAARDSFGGYCYVNHAALVAKQLLHNLSKVAILDIDYHCGNGTSSIFYEDPSVLVLSIHCHPDHEYPFHSGFADQTGDGAGHDCTLHLPLLPGAQLNNTYRDALQAAMTKIRQFGAQALVVSMGLDILKGDPCAIRRAGFELVVDDYVTIGRIIGEGTVAVSEGIPCVVIQEGGYKLDDVPRAAANVLVGMADARAAAVAATKNASKKVLHE